MPSSVSDCPYPENEQETINDQEHEREDLHEELEEARRSNENELLNQEFVEEDMDAMVVGANEEVADDDLDSVLEFVGAYPKAAPRKASNRGRKRKKTAVLTNDDFIEGLRADQVRADQKNKKYSRERRE